MPSQYSEERECPQCHTKVLFTIKSGIYPFRDREIGDCPVCGYEIFHKNITGDIEAEVVSLENTIEPYLGEYKKTKCLG